MKNTNSITEDVWLVYDGECPVCNIYCKYIRIRDAVGALRLVDARHPSNLLDEITKAGLDIDKGMVLKFKGAIYYGSDAIHMLTLLSSPSGVFNRINFSVFSTSFGARIFYPICKVFRNVLLKLLGIKYIGNLKQVR
ncbi:DCC1-like thiol-disulfide oxidoreductase family protein [Undibacterium sp. SXout20W]|uniref:DCC1-like thiol-disulfide oxidoreductase family protein n=1 Tax=Undibacterium sp. SXout20W TaxID=3413051 RepID=UPI003BF08814